MGPIHDLRVPELLALCMLAAVTGPYDTHSPAALIPPASALFKAMSTQACRKPPSTAFTPPRSAAREPLGQGGGPAPLTCILTFVIKAKKSETHLCLPAQWGMVLSVPASTFF